MLKRSSLAAMTFWGVVSHIAAALSTLFCVLPMMVQFIQTRNQDSS
ncbi:MAG TPA: hypothetical protein VH599_21210 [Ktedonobacterales bacterium]